MWRASVVWVLALSVGACATHPSVKLPLYDVLPAESGYTVIIRNKVVSGFDGDDPVDRDELIHQLLDATCASLKHELTAENNRGKVHWADAIGYGKKWHMEYIHEVTCEEAPS